MLARALPRFGLQGAGGSIGITRGKAQSPLILEIHPVRGMSRDHPTREVRVLVLIVDAEARPQADAQMVEAVLGLTPAESRVVAARTAGQSVVEIAEGLSCAESTVRTHLKRVHRKLGIRNQTNSCIESCRWKP
ncbi:helix-turn-helix transcriptional regulator [Candidatus Palauibacter sp.]|uniref:helix-turn-helix transcriptional regulator n=2 Tax=Candidatus Palauibacter sp. TaxID=3101350 RepID=UPI003B5B8EA2